ncbi:MAG: hypothetical protein HUU49_04860 [Candidatus Buchananbacteria bacterium]|nr:hypothetical protein [Candidatus Buchananbacteria bacterium]
MFSKLYRSIILTLLLLAVVGITFSFGAIDTNAQEGLSLDEMTKQAAGAAGYSEETNETTFAKIVGTVVRVFLSLLGVIFISYTVYGGFLWMTAAGNDEKITKAKHIIRDGIIGLIVILSAAGIYYFIAEFLIDTSGTSGGTIPGGG